MVDGFTNLTRDQLNPHQRDNSGALACLTVSRPRGAVPRWPRREPPTRTPRYWALRYSASWRQRPPIRAGWGGIGRSKF